MPSDFTGTKITCTDVPQLSQNKVKVWDVDSDLCDPVSETEECLGYSLLLNKLSESLVASNIC
jgi:hypothetical protein